MRREDSDAVRRQLPPGRSITCLMDSGSTRQAIAWRFMLVDEAHQRSAARVPRPGLRSTAGRRQKRSRRASLVAGRPGFPAASYSLAGAGVATSLSHLSGIGLVGGAPFAWRRPSAGRRGRTSPADFLCCSAAGQHTARHRCSVRISTTRHHWRQRPAAVPSVSDGSPTT